MPIWSHVGEAAGLGSKCCALRTQHCQCRFYVKLGILLQRACGLGRRYGRRLRLSSRPLRHPALGYGVEDGGEVAEWDTVAHLFWTPSDVTMISAVNAACVATKKPVT
jgi:hypothetical protein